MILFAGLGALVQGCVGIGITLVAAPVLVTIDPAFVPGPLLITAQIVGIRHVLAERRHIDLAALRNAYIGLPFGIAIGLAILLIVDERVLSILIGVATASAAAALLAGLRIRRTPRTEIATGAMVAFSSITAALPGPPLVVSFSDMRPGAMRGTGSAIILVVAVIGGVSLAVAGRFGRDELELLALLVPGAVLGLAAARPLRPHLDRTWFRTAVLVVACAGGLALIARQVT